MGSSFWFCGAGGMGRPQAKPPSGRFQRAEPAGFGGAETACGRGPVPAGAGIEMPFPKPALRKNFCLPIVCRFWGGFMRRNVLQYRQKAEQVFYK